MMELWILLIFAFIATFLFGVAVGMLWVEIWAKNGLKRIMAWLDTMKPTAAEREEIIKEYAREKAHQKI